MLPESKRFGVRVVDAKDSHAAFEPKARHRFELLPQTPPITAFEIDWINVLIFFRWILCILNRAVGTVAKPIRMRPNIRMIRCALKRQVESHFETLAARLLHQPIKVSESAEFGMDFFVTAGGGADRPWAARIAGCRQQRIVGALAMSRADRMD